MAGENSGRIRIVVCDLLRNEGGIEGKVNDRESVAGEM